MSEKAIVKAEVEGMPVEKRTENRSNNLYDSTGAIDWWIRSQVDRKRRGWRGLARINICSKVSRETLDE